MDVGFNNRNLFEYESLRDVVFLVEANYFEWFSLWKDMSMGFSIKIGEYKGEPVVVEFKFTMINKKLIGFYTPCSWMVHHGMIQHYLKKNFQLTHDNYCRWNHVNASNFHNCINALDNLDKEPRDTVYKMSENFEYPDKGISFIKKTHY